MKIRLDIFEGPLDLLLYLIKKEHLNIHDITITKVVDQYLQYLDLMKVFDINIASEYLVTAATLISIKSKMLLPKPEIEGDADEDDPRMDLVNKLLEYEKFKEAAEFLKIKELDRKKYVARPQINYNFDDETYIEASIFDLISAFKSALKEVPPDIFFEIIKDEHTVEEKIHDIVRLLIDHKRVNLNDLFSRARSKVEIVVTFLAILELIKMREIIALQDNLFGPVSLARRTAVAEPV